MVSKKGKISIFGLGYVGCVSSACFAKKGFDVIGVDIDSTKIDSINNGRSPIIEPELNSYIKDVVSKQKLKATIDVNFAINNSDISIICVETHSLPNAERYYERAITLPIFPKMIDQDVEDVI